MQTVHTHSMMRPVKALRQQKQQAAGHIAMTDCSIKETRVTGELV